ncbi:MAG: FtsH protease activity modulator HflK, partial [Pseudomonadota bacterium]
ISPSATEIRNNMPWSDNSNNGGGPRGGGKGPNKGPWGRPSGRPNGGGGGGGAEPPDLEELIKASRQRFKRAFPSGGRGGRSNGGGGGRGPELNARTGGFLAVGLLLLWGLSGFYQVSASDLGVVTRFGQFQKITTPGLHWHIPSPIEAVRTETVLQVRNTYIPQTRGQRGPQAEGLMLTGDKNIVDVEMVVQWVIKPGAEGEDEDLPGVAQYVFNIDGPENLVRTVGEASIREIVGRNTLDFVQTTGRSTVGQDTRKLMQATLDAQKSGIVITEVNLEKTEPPTAEVNEAFLDVEAAKQDKEQFINTARAYANQVVPQARGEAQRILEEARAYQARVTAQARGQADRFSQILSEYEKAPEVTRQRMYLETVEDVLGGMNKVIIEESAGGGVVPYLPLTELQKKGGE